MQLGWIQGLGAGFHVPEFFDASLPSLNDVGLEPRPVSKNLAAGLQTLQGNSSSNSSSLRDSWQKLEALSRICRLQQPVAVLSYSLDLHT